MVIGIFLGFFLAASGFSSGFSPHHCMELTEEGSWKKKPRKTQSYTSHLHNKTLDQYGVVVPQSVPVEVTVMETKAIVCLGFWLWL